MSEQKKSTSPKTTAGAVVVLLGAILACASVFLDGDPSTTLTVEHVGAVVASGGVAWALWKARDHDVSSEAAGAK